MSSTPSISEVYTALRTLPDDFTIHDEAIDGSVQILYGQRLIGSWDPTSGKTRLEMSLLEVDMNLLAVNIDQLAGTLQFLQDAGFRLTRSQTMPFGQNDSDVPMEIIETLLFEGLDIRSEHICEAVLRVQSISHKSIDSSRQ